MFDIAEIMPTMVQIVETAAGVAIFFAIAGKVVSSISNAFRGRGKFL